jgi:hypothetical protein
MSQLTTWIRENEIPIRTIAPYITATVLTLTFYGTIRIQRAQKKSETAAEFGSAFIQLMEQKHKLETNQIDLPRALTTQETQQQQVTDFLASEARHYYAQFFAFQFSEFHAYKNGYIGKDVFSIWMKSRWREFRAPEAIHGVTYAAGWDHWKQVRHNNAEDEFVRFMREIHGCQNEAGVERVVTSFGPWWQRWRGWRPQLSNFIFLLVGGILGFAACRVFGS